MPGAPQQYAETNAGFIQPVRDEYNRDQYVGSAVGSSTQVSTSLCFSWSETPSEAKAIPLALLAVMTLEAAWALPLRNNAMEDLVHQIRASDMS